MLLPPDTKLAPEQQMLSLSQVPTEGLSRAPPGIERPIWLAAWVSQPAAGEIPPCWTQHTWQPSVLGKSSSSPYAFAVNVSAFHKSRGEFIFFIFSHYANLTWQNISKDTLKKRSWWSISFPEEVVIIWRPSPSIQLHIYICVSVDFHKAIYRDVWLLPQADTGTEVQGDNALFSPGV